MSNNSEGDPGKNIGEVFSEEIQAYYENLACRDSARKCQIGMSAVALASLVLCRSVGAHEVAWVDDVIEVSSGTVCFLSTLAVGGATVGQYLFRRDQTEPLPDIVQD